MFCHKNQILTLASVLTEIPKSHLLVGRWGCEFEIAAFHDDYGWLACFNWITDPTNSPPRNCNNYLYELTATRSIAKELRRIVALDWDDFCTVEMHHSRGLTIGGVCLTDGMGKPHSLPPRPAENEPDMRLHAIMQEVVQL